MEALTSRQQQVLDYIQASQTQHGVVPTMREIARQFGFRSMTAAADHVRALRRKGYLVHNPRAARSHSVIQTMQTMVPRSLVQVPLYGTIPAGFADERTQEADRTVAIDFESLGLRPDSKVFALEVRGDSMINRHICDGDIAIIDRSRTPKQGDVVAALIDRESTLKTLEFENGRPYLRPENPHYLNLHPSHELLIQGVMVALVRRHV
jgi:repressor LexA